MKKKELLNYAKNEEIKVLVLTGSGNGEDLPSERTGQNVTNVLKKLGYDVCGLVFDQDTFIDKIRSINPDVVFNGMHGVYGEDGRVQSVLDLMRIPYTHSNHYASSAGFNKNLTKYAFMAFGIPSPRSVLVSRDDVLSGKYIDLAESIVSKEYVIKPNCSGSTVGLILKTGSNLKTPINPNEVIEMRDFLIEEYIPGREFSTFVFNGKAIGSLETGSNDSEEILTYDVKYLSGTCRHDKPLPEDQDIIDKIHRYAELAYESIGCSGIARCDFRINESRLPFILEINTHPGAGDISFIPYICKYNNLLIDEVFDHLVRNADYS